MNILAILLLITYVILAADLIYTHFSNKPTKEEKCVQWLKKPLPPMPVEIDWDKFEKKIESLLEKGYEPDSQAQLRMASLESKRKPKPYKPKTQSIKESIALQEQEEFYIDQEAGRIRYYPDTSDPSFY